MSYSHQARQCYRDLQEICAYEVQLNFSKPSLAQRTPVPYLGAPQRESETNIPVWSGTSYK